jgi:hypothetical protein
MTPLLNSSHSIIYQNSMHFYYSSATFVTPNYFTTPSTEFNELNPSHKLDLYLNRKNDYDVFALLNFLHLKYSHFSKFFIDHSLDTPTCFLKTTSNKRKISYLYLLKLVNYLTNSGKKEKTFKTLNSVLSSFFNSPYNN